MTHELKQYKITRHFRSAVTQVPMRAKLACSISLLAAVALFALVDLRYGDTLLPHKTVLLRRLLFAKNAELEADLLYDTLWDQVSNPDTSSLWMTPPGPGFSVTAAGDVKAAQEEIDLKVDSSTSATVTVTSNRWPHLQRKYVFQAKDFAELEFDVLEWLKQASINIDLRPARDHAGIPRAYWRSFLLANQQIGWSRPSEQLLKQALSELSSVTETQKRCVICLVRKAQAEALLARITDRVFYADESRKDMNAALALDTWNGAICRVAQVRFVLGDRRDAIYIVEHLGFDLLASEQGKMLSGRFMAEDGETHHAISSLNEALKMNPFDLNAYTFRGLAQMSLGQYNEAIASYKESLTIEPGNIRDLNNLAFAYLRAGDPEDALRPLEQLLATKPTAMGYVNLGLALFALHRGAAGLPYCEKAAEMSPRAEIYTGYLAHAQRWMEMRNEARATYMKAITLAAAELKISERPEIYSDLAVYYAALGRQADSRAAIERARQLTSSDVETDYKECVALVLLGDYEEAREHLRLLQQNGYSVKCLQRDPDLARLF